MSMSILNLLIHLLIWGFFKPMMYFLALWVTELSPICNPVSFLDGVKETDVYLCMLLGQSMSHWFWECCVCLTCLHDEWAPPSTEGKNKTKQKSTTWRFCNFLESPCSYFMIKSKHVCSSLMGAVYSQTHSSFWGPFQLLNSALAFCVRTEAYWECLMWLSHLITQKRTSVFYETEWVCPSTSKVLVCIYRYSLRS